MHEALSALDLARYRALLNAATGEPCSLAVESDGRSLLQVGEREGDPSRRLALLDYQRQPIGELLAWTRAPVDDALWDALADSLQSEVGLHRDLIDMADELTTRYEELNLVFDASDEVTTFSETSNRLQDIVDGCHEYMRVDFCLLVLRSQNLYFESTKESELSVLSSQLVELGKPIMRWLTEHRGSHVYNGGNNHNLPIAAHFSDSRHIVTPILTGSAEHVAGFLIVGRPAEDELFTNSDKNLLEVMARKVSKIVRSTYDDLTSLLRRQAFEAQVDNAVANANAEPQRDALVVLDLDRMQVINDAIGHDAGDHLLKLVANRLDRAVSSDDVVARLGGDEFGVLLSGRSREDLYQATAQLVDSINHMRFEWRSRQIEVAASAGITLISPDTPSAANAMAEAELACAAAKERGGQRFAVFDSDDSQLVERHAQMHQVSVIQRALKEDRFELYAQPIKPLANPDRPLHAEILLRLRDDNGEIVSPGLFLPAAERYHLMPSVDRWVVKGAFAAFAGSAAEAAGITLTINLSGQTLTDETFVAYVRHCQTEFQPRTGSICFEVTETAAIGDLRMAQDFMAELRELGFTFALDDFGTGLSSFSYLRDLKLDALKIDGSFVREILHDPVARTMVQAINDVGQAMGLVTIAEFVTEVGIADELRSMGVDYGQGFALAKPIPVQAFLDSLEERDVKASS